MNVMCHFGNKGFIYKLYVKSTLIGQHFIYSWQSAFNNIVLFLLCDSLFCFMNHKLNFRN